MRNIAFLFLFINQLIAQQVSTNFRYPLDTNPILTGNYGELRPNHFHAGLDFTTDPKRHLPIYAVEDGYISRIKISPYGYGKVIYITHPNGYVTVYAHQHSFTNKLNTYIKTQQYKLQMYELELFPQLNDFPVKKGDVIGYTGNTGGSTGPHLHFEIREEKSEVPLNPLLFYKLKDTIKPTITHVALYETKDTLNVTLKNIIPVKQKKGNLLLENDSLILNNNLLALGVSCYDKEVKNGNSNNVYSLKVVLDGKLIYHHALNDISFDNGRYVNVFSEKTNNIKIQRCFTPINNSLSIYKTLINGGKIHLKDTLFHELKIVAEDESGNQNELHFYLKSKKLLPYQTLVKTTNYVNCLQEFKKDLGDAKITIPPRALYNDCNLNIKLSDKNKYGASLLVNNAAPVHKPICISLKPNTRYINQHKLVIMNGTTCLVGVQEGDYITVEAKNFGTFYLMLDTVPPIIKPTLSKKRLKTLSAVNQLSFKIEDSLSGIKSYNLYINNNWVLSEYDAKNDLLTYYFDESTPKGKLNVRLEVSDKKENTTIYKLQSIR